MMAYLNGLPREINEIIVARHVSIELMDNHDGCGAFYEVRKRGEKAKAYEDHVRRDITHLHQVIDAIDQKLDAAKVLKLVPRANMPNADLVALLERMLENAKSGELEGVAVACVWSNDSISWGNSAGCSTHRTLAAIANLQHGFWAKELG